MKIHLIASPHMKKDDMPYMVVSMKQYDELVNNAGTHKMEFEGAGKLHELANKEIYTKLGVKPDESILPDPNCKCSWCTMYREKHEVKHDT